MTLRKTEILEIIKDMETPNKIEIKKLKRSRTEKEISSYMAEQVYKTCSFLYLNHINLFLSLVDFIRYFPHPPCIDLLVQE